MSDSAASPPIPAPATTAAAAPVCRAIVDCGTIETEYLRAGHGPTVVYLGAVRAATDLREDMLQTLATCFRVIAPESTSISAMVRPQDGRQTAFTRWLLGVLDGLGIARASLVVEAPLAGEAASFVHDHPARLDRVVLLGVDPRAEAPDATPPMLVVAHGADAATETLRVLSAREGTARAADGRRG